MDGNPEISKNKLQFPHAYSPRSAGNDYGKGDFFDRHGDRSLRCTSEKCGRWSLVIDPW